MTSATMSTVPSCEGRDALRVRHHAELDLVRIAEDLLRDAMDHVDVEAFELAAERVLEPEQQRVGRHARDRAARVGGSGRSKGFGTWIGGVGRDRLHSGCRSRASRQSWAWRRPRPASVRRRGCRRRRGAARGEREREHEGRAAECRPSEGAHRYSSSRRLIPRRAAMAATMPTRSRTSSSASIDRRADAS